MSLISRPSKRDIKEVWIDYKKTRGDMERCDKGKGAKSREILG